ncbi:unnamed protein product [Amaranthus hypochondriacus]
MSCSYSNQPFKKGLICLPHILSLESLEADCYFCPPYLIETTHSLTHLPEVLKPVFEWRCGACYVVWMCFCCLLMCGASRFM